VLFEEKTRCVFVEEPGTAFDVFLRDNKPVDFLHSFKLLQSSQGGRHFLFSCGIHDGIKEREKSHTKKTNRSKSIGELGRGTTGIFHVLFSNGN
jgi:hypothetical protein